jgi:uncharacterized Zn-binding protein involved in type VI secretion
MSVGRVKTEQYVGHEREEAMRCASLLLIPLVGCASIPDTTVTYYPSKTSTTVTATHVIACSKDGSQFAIVSETKMATVAMADLSTPETIDTKHFKNNFGNSNVTITLRDDGRLAGFNGDTTGAGGELVKAAIGLVTGSFAKAVPEELGTPDMAKFCGAIGIFGKENALTYVEQATITAPNGIVIGKSIDLEPDLASRTVKARFDADLREFLPRSQLIVGPAKSLKQLPASVDGDVHVVKLRGVQRVPVSVEVKALGTSAWLPGEELTLPVSSAGTEVLVPIAKPAMFGTSSFALELSEVGAVTKLTYGAKDAVTPAIGSFASAVQAIHGRSAAEKAAELNAQADLIAAATRLANCRSTPGECE